MFGFESNNSLRRIINQLSTELFAEVRMFPQVISAKGRKLFAKHTQPDKIVLPIRLGKFRILLLHGLTLVVHHYEVDG